ncbi:tandem-95 repeat protein [Gimesia panareensis]|uniref:tandem-95 repeat protein n=1 Tax=Gimesia panareensis TaxID=2527978 RepID=UPI0018D5B3F3|nr:Ig-like domain-containing protein [Gimesia panareensis]
MNQPNDSTELLLTVGPGSTPTLGFEVHGTSGSFDPAAVQILDANTNAVIPLNLAENNHGGTTDSLTLATLAPGEYSIFVSGQTAATGNFTIDIFMPGDSDGSGSVSDTEYQYALAASYQNLFGFNHYTSQLIQSMGLDPTKNYYSEEQDSDKDGDIDNHDLEMMNSNRNVPPLQLELIGDQDAPAVVAGLLIDSGVSNSDGITNDLTIVGNVTDESLITQFKVALDGGSFVDIFGQLSGGASGGTFTLTRSWLETNLNGGSSLEGGVHTLHFMTADEHGNVSAPGDFDVSFELDVTDPTVASPIGNQTLNEDFVSFNLGPFTDFFNQNGGTPLSYNVYSITSAIVDFDFATDELILTSKQDANGSADIVIQAIDAAGNAVLSNTFTVTVNAINDAPVAVDDNLATPEDFELDYLAPGILTNDTDVENDPLTVTEVNGSAGDVGNEITIGAGGKLTINSTGAMSFDPDGAYEYLAVGETTTETFTYTVSDGNGGTDTATVTITIIGVNDDPTAADTGIAATEDGGTVTTGVLTGDVDSDDDATTLTYVITAQPSEGSATSNDDGTFTFDPGSDFQDLAVGETRQVTFTYTATDSHSAVSNTGTVTVTVTGVNDDPTAADVGIAAVEDGATVDGSFDGDDVDSDDTPASLTYAITSTPSEGGVVNNNDGSFTFDPGSDFQDLAAGETRQVTFTYTATDSHSAVSNTGTVTVTVTGVNDDPTAADTGIAATEDGGTVTTGVLTGDVDSDDDATTLTYAITAQPSEGSATSNDDGTFTFDPGSDFQDLAVGETRQVTFTYTATDSHSAVSNTGTVTVTVTGVNDDPTVADVGIAAVEDGATVDGSFDGDDVDSDDTPASLTYAITSTPSEGGVVNNNDGSFTFDPGSDFQDLAAGETRQVTFTYTATDSHSAVSNTGTVTVTVTGVNDDPTAADTGIAATEDGSTVTTGVLTGDVDSDDDATTLTYAITAQPSEGSATSNDDGTFTFDPGSDFQDLAAGETRQVTFTYTATDSHSAVSNTGTVTVTVTGVNDAPTAADTGIAATEDGSTVTTGVLTGDVDSDDDATTLTYAITAQPSEGSAISNDDGSFTFDPGSDFQDLAAGETRQVTFTYTATDSHSAVSNTGTVTVTVTGVNDDPTAADTGIAATEDGSTVTTGVLTGDVDSDDDANTLTYAITAQPSEGSATSNDDGTFTFDPGSDFQDLAAGETRLVTFTYTATDSHSAVSNTGTVTVTVTGVNDAPTAADTGIAATEDGSTVTTGVLTGDVDSDDDATTLTYAITAQPSEGSATSNDDGSFTFDPGSDFQDLAAGETRQVTFTYTATDSHSAVSNTGTVTVTVTGVNDDPTAADTGIAATEDGSTVTTGVLTGDVDSDDDATTLTYAITAQPSEGSASSNDDGTFTFDPGSDFQDLAAGETRQVTFTYTATDSHSAVSNTGTVTVTVTGVNDDPTAADTGIAATEDGSTVTTGVLTGDVDSDDDATTLTYAITAQPSEGSASSNDDGTFTFDPGSDFQDLAVGETRQVTFTYTATDSHSAVSNTGTVTVTVTGVNDPPVANDDAIDVNKEIVFNGSVLVNNGSGIDSDPDTSDNPLLFISQLNSNALVDGATVTLASGAELTMHADGNFTYDPTTLNQSILDSLVGTVTFIDSFTYQLNDTHSGVDVATVTVTVSANQLPIANPDSAATDEETPILNIDVLGNDTDPDQITDPPTVANLPSMTSTGGASLTLNLDGTIDYDPTGAFDDLAAGATTTDTFTYTLEDERGGQSLGTVTVTLTGVNDAPTAGDEGIAATEDGSTVTTGVLTGDVDSDDDATTLTYAITAQPSEGSATSNDDGTFTFDPGSDFQDLAVGETRQVTFTYTATDSHSAVSNTGTVTVTVTGVNDDPTVADVGIAADEDGATVDGSFDGDDVDSDDTPASLTYAITSTPSEGGVVNNNDGSFTFDPGSDFQDLAAGETRQVTFTYTATDSHSAVSNTGTVTVTVTGVNDDPTAADTGIAATEDGSTVTTGVLTGDVDSDDDATTLTYAITAQPSEGSASSNDDGTFTFDPGSDFQDLAAGETRQVTFTYTATDSHSAVSNTGTVTVTVTGVNDDPTAADTGIAATEDGSTVTTGVLTGDVDSDDDATTLTYAITAQPSEGSASSNDDGSFTFDPGSDFQDLAAGETRQVTFTYTATDSHSAVSNTGTVTVTVTGVNDDPTAADTGIAATEDGGTVTTGVLTGDVDSDDDATTLTYAITAQPSEGSATSNDDGTFTFDPGSDFQDLAVGETRQVTFTYTATDSHSAVSNTGTVTVTVTGVNDDPTVADVGIAAVEDGATVDGSFDGADVDSDDTPASLTYAITSTPSEGGVVNNNDGSFTFDPGSDFQDLAAGETRQVTFTYTATDSHSAVSNTGTVTVTVTGVNDDPTAADTGIAATEDGGTVTTGVLTGDVDSDDDATTLTYAITAQPSEGSATSNDDGTFTFDPGSDFQDLAVGETRQVTFTYTATDSHSAVSNTGTVTVTVTGVNDDPTAADVGIAAVEDGATVDGSFDGDDVDSDDTPVSLTYAITSTPSEGGVVNNNDGSFTFDPGSDFQDLAAGETRQVTFTYTATDSHSAVSNTGTVTVTVTGVNDDPTAADTGIAATEDGSTVTTGVLTGDVDSDDDATTLTYAITAQPSEGSATSNDDGTFTFDPGSDFQDLAVGETRQVTFTYTATDSHSAVSNTGTVTVTVTGVNDDPTAADTGIAATEDGSTVTTGVLTGDVDSDDDATTLTYAITAQPSEGSATSNDDGSFTFDPGSDFQDLAAGETRQVTFTYTATDSHSAVSNTGTVTVTVTGVNDPVTAKDDDITTSKDNTVNFDARLDNGNGPDLDPDTSDMLSVFEITDTTLGTVAATVGGAITLDSGATLTLQTDGTLTYDPNGQFSGLVLPTDTATDTFTYSISDGNGSSDTATVTVTVTGSNELLELTTPLPDISSDGLSPETIDLDTHFNDPDAGDTVTYSIVSAELVGGGSFPAKFWVDNVGISGSDLNITFTDYKSDQVRLPIEIKVKAHSSDTLSPDVEDTFILSPDPQQTIDIQLLARNTVSADRDFTSFRAEGGVTSQGGARFQLVNSQQDMTYLVDLSDFFLDLDGTGTGDPNDNLSKLEIIDTANGNNVLFKIFDSATADDNPTLDTASSLLTGTWAAGEGFTSGILDKFYNGDLAVRYSSSGGVTGIVSGGNIMVSPEVDGIGSLPSQINQVIEGSSYVVEIWVSDQLAQVLASQTTETRDLVAVWLDLVWNDTSAVHADFSSATGDASAFGTTDDGVIMNGAGKVDDIKGLTRIPGFGENGYARIGYVSFIADTPTPDADPIDFSVNFTPGDDSITRGTEVDFSQISINGTSVNQIGTSEFLIQTDMSNVSVNGTININGEVVNLSAQDVGLDNTSVSGRLEVLFDDVNNPSTIQIVDSFIDVNPAGLALPDRVADNDNLTAEELADFGLSGVLSNFNGTGNPANISMAIRDALVQVLSSEQTLDGSGNFDISENWNLTNGDLYSMTVVPAFGNLVVDDSVESTAGEIMTFIDPVTGFPSGLPDWSHANLSEISAGLYELLIPISRQISFTTSGGYDVVLNLTGYATARFLVDQETTDQYGDTIATAQATGLSSTSTGTNTYYGGIGNNTSIADPLSDVDMFQVQLNAGDSVIVDVDADQFDTGLDSVVRIFDAAGNEVAYSDDDLAPDEFTIDFASNYDSYVTFTASTSGNYYIGVSAYNFTDDPASYDPTTTTGRPTGVDPSDVGSYDLHITVQNGAAPLHGTQAAVSDAPLEDGTSVDMVVVRNQTQLDSTGQTSSLPTSDTWIDEWSSFWVEIYVETADAKGITDAIANLNYNTNFFTATAIEFGNSFADNGTAIIDDANGVVTGLSGTAQYDKAGNLKKALLARVKFESLEQDDVSIDFEDKFIGPHALGLSLSNVSVNLTDNAETTLIVGDAPETDLWAIAYDVNDDDSIDFRDLVILASIYNQNVLDADSPYVWALDADKSGTVNFKDLTFFASNYGVHKGGNKEVVYPPNFLQRWYGQTTNISGDSSINDVMDTALGIWQDALGMDEPLDIQLVITDLGGTQLGEGQISAVDEQGRPVAGIVTLDDDAAGLGWYSDVSTTAFGGGDLEGGVSYTADMNSDAAGHYDLLTVLLHEIGHVLGFTDTYAPFESHVQAGVGGTLSFVGNGFEATLTDDGLHLDDTVHAGDVMNATLDPGVRKLPSILDALILQTAHETAATGNFDILVGATAPLTASDVPLTGNGDSVLPEALQPLTTLAVPYTDVVSVPVSSESASSQDEGSGSSLPVVWRQVLNTLSQNLSSGSDQSDLDLTLLDGLNEEFVQTLRENGLSIVESGEIHSFDFSDLDPADWQLTGLDQDGDGGFDEVFSDWAGPIL